MRGQDRRYLLVWTNYREGTFGNIFYLPISDNFFVIKSAFDYAGWESELLSEQMFSFLRLSLRPETMPGSVQWVSSRGQEVPSRPTVYTCCPSCMCYSHQLLSGGQLLYGYITCHYSNSCEPFLINSWQCVIRWPHKRKS